MVRDGGGRYEDGMRTVRKWNGDGMEMKWRRDEDGMGAVRGRKSGKNVASTVSLNR